MNFRKEIASRGEKARLNLIEKCQKHINPAEPLRDAAMHYLKGGGKGFRPAMLQLVCGALGGDEELALPPATAIEAIHVSSLIHDDYMDQDEVRRGLVSVWKKWNPTIAILAGDVLFGLAFSIAGEVPGLSEGIKYGINQELAQIYTRLCEGQMYDIQFETEDVTTISVEDITNMQYLKTGILFEFSCITGARLALNKMEDPLINVVREYAKLAGTAFQIQDDIIGLIGKEEEIGKPVGSDVRQGKRTLIAIHAFENANEKQKEQMLKGFGNPNASKEDIQKFLDVVNEIGSITSAKSLAQEKAEKAKKLTLELPQNLQTKVLAEFSQYMVDRSF
jgi:geranylgeranyl diphosphate synthase type I